MSDAPDARVRLDKWLWAARFFKTRSAAAQAVEGGKVKLDEARVKPARALKVGDRLEIQIGSHAWSITVLALSERRGPAEHARTLYAEDEQSRARRAAQVAARRDGSAPVAAPGGRPEKRARRILQRLRGH